mmetsp:Transcript_2386/g.5356  ORF Transcript_2386/g.5356 Transcript_2386/m.5356 type:complete len:230 (-) Transcript_2386:303-992(-)
MEGHPGEGGIHGHRGRAGQNRHGHRRGREQVGRRPKPEPHRLHPLRRHPPGFHAAQPDLAEVRRRVRRQAPCRPLPSRRIREEQQSELEVLLALLLHVGVWQHGAVELLVLELLHGRARPLANLAGEALLRHPVGRLGRGRHGCHHGRRHAPACDDGAHAVLHGGPGPRGPRGRTQDWPARLQRLHRQPADDVRHDPKRPVRDGVLHAQLLLRVRAAAPLHHRGPRLDI